MPAKRPAPKSATGKKTASRPAGRPVGPPKKPLPAVPAARGEPPVELRRPLRAGAATAPPPATATMTTSSRAAATPAVNADGEDGETIEPGSLLAGPRNVQPYIVKRGEQYMSKQ